MEETVKISELEATNTINDSDILPIVQSGVTKKVTTANLLSDVYDTIEEAYSTSETLTNKVWVDGKPIYRKVFNNYTITTGTTLDDILLETDTNKNLIDSYGIVNIVSGSSNWKVPIGTPDVGFGAIGKVYQNQSGLLYLSRTHGAFGTLTGANIVVEYTKTTD